MELTKIGKVGRTFKRKHEYLMMTRTETVVTRYIDLKFGAPSFKALKPLLLRQQVN